MFDRRALLTSALGGGLLASSGLLPAWARSASQGNIGLSQLTGDTFDLVIDHTPVRIAGKAGKAITINGTVPGPLLRFKEGETVTLKVTNRLHHDTSIHWHGLLVPNPMDGVPGVTFPGIKPGETFTYKYEVPQAGTYWYHSHSGLQEQLGHYGPLILDPAGPDPVSADREYVLVLSDWSFMDPHRIFDKLKKQSDSFNFQERTVGDFIEDAGEMGLGAAFKQRAMWGAMRMSPADIADVTGSTYYFLINGHAPEDNWTALFQPGERIRLRIINASAMSILNFRIPGLPMTVVQADGLNVKPVETDELQIGVAETYDVIVTPNRDRAYAIVAESIDRSGQGVATLAPRADMRATAPLLRDRPTLTMKDMGMSHSMAGMAMGSDSGGGKMDHSGHDMSGGGHDAHDMTHDAHKMGAMDHGAGEMQTHDHPRGVGVDSVAMEPTNRLNEPGLGLENLPHRTLTYADLRSLDPNPDTRPHEREVEIHLTGNMERFMWSFDGVKFSEVVDPIVFYKGERVRLTMVNDTMMTHPIHLHGMFFDVVNGADHDKPRKHTINVKPGEKLSVDVTPGEEGDWAFHCHLLYHMHAGMMHVVSVRQQQLAEADQ